MVKVLYFASFREVLGKPQEQLPADIHSVEELLKRLAERGEVWQQALLNNPNLQIAVNQDMADRQTPIRAGDEVAFFPPVTGG